MRSSSPPSCSLYCHPSVARGNPLFLCHYLYHLSRWNGLTSISSHPRRPRIVMKIDTVEIGPTLSCSLSLDTHLRIISINCVGNRHENVHGPAQNDKWLPVHIQFSYQQSNDNRMEIMKPSKWGQFFCLSRRLFIVFLLFSFFTA